MFNQAISHWKNSIAKRIIFWSSEPENIAIKPILRYGPQNCTSIGETAIQVRWYDNTMYSDRKQNIMPSLSLLWILARDKNNTRYAKMIFQRKKKCSKQIDKRFEKTPRKNDTYTAWVETLYTGIGRTAVYFSNSKFQNFWWDPQVHDKSLRLIINVFLFKTTRS